MTTHTRTYTIEVFAIRLRLRRERLDGGRTQEKTVRAFAWLWRRWQRKSGYIHSLPRVRIDEDPATGQRYLVSWARCLKAPEDAQERIRLQEMLDRKSEGLKEIA